MGKEIEVSSIEKYYGAKIINLGETLTGFKSGETKLGEISGSKSLPPTRSIE
jgi:hypothetical protein